MPSTVTVHYPFHPLVHQHLKVISWPRNSTGATTVQHPDGNTIKIPVWMLQSEAAQFHQQSGIEFPGGVLLSLVELLISHLCSTVKPDIHPEQANATSRDALREPCGSLSGEDLDE
ncbi:MAG: hypothetical protein ACI8P9_004692 [Parasphingorhabdus sp.]|jgi:hypothetical protein